MMPHATRTLVAFAALAVAIGPVAVAAGPVPARIAVFAFELDDFSAGAGIAGDPASDRRYLDEATREALKLIGESGRYVLVDPAPAGDDDVRERTLYRCHGCEAPIALRLGADLSFLGVITRISRTDYAVRFEIRDARTGDLVRLRQSDLRIGADYAWSRGARALIRQGLLDAR